jgi:hypothetical protein
MNDKIISNFWAAVWASVILTATALLLDGNEHAGKVITGEIAAFGIRIGDQAMRAYNKSKRDIINSEIILEQTKQRS